MCGQAVDAEALGLEKAGGVGGVPHRWPQNLGLYRCHPNRLSALDRSFVLCADHLRRSGEVDRKVAYAFNHLLDEGPGAAGTHR